MVAIRLTAEVSEDRRLIIDLPDSIPPGRVVLTVQTLEGASESENPSREAARRILLEAGALATNLGIPDDIEVPTEEELETLGQLPPGARPSEDLIDEDRGLY